MEKQVILTMMPGKFEQGIPVILQIRPKGIQIAGKLPQTDKIVGLFNQWQSDYRRIVMSDSRLKPLQNQLTNLSSQNLGADLSQGINNWLETPEKDWQNIREALIKNLDEADDILVIIETEDLLLRQLPWQLWNLFSNFYTRSEFALSVPSYQMSRKATAVLDNQVKILAILGESEDLDLQKDKAILKQLPKSETTFLTNPQQQELSDQLWDQRWKILFFAGHSFSQTDGKTGQIYINDDNSIALSELKHGLKTAIEGGLQLAIFNSCDGLGLARELTDLNIPLIIVMREPVADLVAQEFLKHFLKAFSQGKSLYLAMREARERLQGLGSKFPCASWLPVLCQNANTKAPTWEQLCGNVNRDLVEVPAQPQKRRMLPSRRLVQTVLLISVITTALVIGVRYIGLLQSWELQTFDQTLRRRPEGGPGEGLDTRFLVVTIDEDDLNLPEQGKREKILPSEQALAKEKSLPPEQALAKEKSSLSDQALTILLKKLQDFKAKAIGLDIYRDFEATNQGNLKSIMTSNGNLFAICRARVLQHHEHGILPPPEIPKKRRGFSDVVVDGDRVLRRHLLAMIPKSTSGCVTPYALSTRLALHYLRGRGIGYKYNKEELQVGNVVFKRLRNHMGGYQVMDDWGYQILLNYRSYHDSPSEFVSQVSLKEALSNQLNPESVKDKIVIIGVTARSTGNDYFQSPYSTGKIVDDDMPGVIIQAQMVSQIVSAALKERPLLSVWHWGAEVLWIWGWSVIGGSLFWWIRAPLKLAMAIIGLEVCLCFFCYGFLVYYAVWVPLVPSGLVLVCSTIGVAAAMHSSRDAA